MDAENLEALSLDQLKEVHTSHAVSIRNLRDKQMVIHKEITRREQIRELERLNKDGKLDQRLDLSVPTVGTK